MKRNCAFLIIIQARADSNRLPKKVLSTIEGKPMLWHVINRAKKIKGGKIIVATTRRKIDNSIVTIAKNSRVAFFRGKKDDVLDRYYQAAKKFGGKTIARITADCPLLDPKESRRVIQKFFSGNFDYVTNGEGTYPDGLDTECFSFDVLEYAWKNATLRSEREHVTPFIKKNLKESRIFILKNRRDLSDQRWTVDEKEDLEFVRKIYARMRPNKIFSMKDVLKIIQSDPKLIDINRKFLRNEGYIISLRKDKSSE